MELLHLVLPVLILQSVAQAKHLRGLKNNCPAEEVVSPCLCRPNYDGSCMIRCYAVDESALTNLTKVPNLCGGNIQLTLVHSVVNAIPRDLWKSLLSSKSVDISLMYSNVKHLLPPGEEPLPPIYSPGEAYLKVQHSSSIALWDWKQLKDFKAGDELNVIIDDTPLRTLSKDFALVGGGVVEKVFIDRAELSEVPDGVFQNLSLLYSLSLQDNSISEVRRSMFPLPATNLRFLHLNGNLMQTLPVNLFSDMPSLEVVYLRENKLTTLPKDIFKKVNAPKLRLVDLIKNPWHCNCHLAKIVSDAEFQVDMGTCATPDYLKGKKVKNVAELINC